MASKSLYRHAHNWIPTLALQDTRPLHTKRRYIDLIEVE